MSDVSPKLYVGTYGKYNAGNLDGKWLDLDDYVDPDDFWEACKELHANEHDPEYMFQDFEGFPERLYQESASPDNIKVLFWFIKLEHYERQIVEGYAEAIGQWPEPDDCASFFDEAQEHLFCTLTTESLFDNARDLGYYMIEEGLFGEVPERLENYLNYEAIGRDALMEMTVVRINGERMVFTA
jgi:antirestriction protein